MFDGSILKHVDHHVLDATYRVKSAMVFEIDSRWLVDCGLTAFFNRLKSDYLPNVFEFCFVH